MRKKIIAVCLAVMLACLLWLVKDRWSLPAVQETEHEGLRVGLSQAEPLTPWKTAQIKSFKEAARRRGAQLIYHAPEEESWSGRSRIYTVFWMRVLIILS